MTLVYVLAERQQHSVVPKQAPGSCLASDSWHQPNLDLRTAAALASVALYAQVFIPGGGQIGRDLLSCKGSAGGQRQRASRRER